jgi:hypothetical protein
LEFIFENPIAIIFIIGAVISFLKKMKENSNPNSNQEKKPEWKKVMDIPQTLNEDKRVETRTPREPREHQQNRNQLQQEYNRAKSKAEIDQPKVQAIQRIETNKKVVITEVDASDLTPTKDTLIDGIVWSEILGPPRAYKSHSQRRASYRR